MSTNMFRFLGFLFILGLTAAPNLLGEDKNKPSTIAADETINVEAELKETGVINTFQAKLDLGELPMNKVVDVFFTLKNPYDYAIHFEETTVNCSCLGFKAAQKVIPANDSTLFQFRLTTVGNSRVPFVQAAMGLEKKSQDPLEQVRVGIGINYRLKNFLRFDRSLNMLELSRDEGIGSVYVPFHFTDPIQLGNLEASLSDSIRDLVCEVTEHQGKPCVRIDVGKIAVESGSLAGEIKLRDSSSNAEANTFFTAKPHTNLTVSPNVLRFSEDSDNPGTYECSAIIRLNLEKKVADAKPKSKKQPEQTQTSAKKRTPYQVGVRINKTLNPRVESKRLSDNIIRVKLTLDLPEDEAKLEDVFPVDWTLLGGNLSLSASTKGMFSDN